MSASGDLELMRATMLLESDPGAAARQASELLAKFPDYDGARLLLAAACRRLGDAAGMVHAMELLAQAQPRSAFLQLELGRALAGSGRRAEAIAALERAVTLDSALADAWCELSAQRLWAGDIAMADIAYSNYRQQTPESPEHMDARVALRLGRFDAAEEWVRKRLRHKPDDVEALRLLAASAAGRGDDAVAEATLIRILQLENCDNAERETLAHLLVRQGRVDDALPLIERLIQADPGNITFMVLKAEALRLAARHAEGLAIAEGLVAESPQESGLWLIVGNQQRYIGQAGLAIEAYRQAIELRPSFGEAYWALSNLKTFHFPRQDIENMRAQLANRSISPADVKYLEYALGKALEDETEYAESFEHYARANARVRAEFGYNADASQDFARRFKATFTREFFAERADWGDASAEPIFIVGLPRSGSTLLEQILAAHSMVEATQELTFVQNMARNLASNGHGQFPENVASLAKADIDSLAAQYLERTQPFRPEGKPRFIDKMLGNFVSFGLIQLMFPRSAIIDSRRHPMACGFSCFKQLFNPGMNFAYDLTELGRYIRDYADIMEHVDTVLPGQVYRAHYENVVNGTEGAVRGLLAYCGLPFEAQCLRHQDNARVAQTISSEQVRRPVYTEALDQWRHFEPWLGPLRAEVASLIEQYPLDKKNGGH
jgi:tetratricopeptide (TPR) repeat protein